MVRTFPSQDSPSFQGGDSARSAEEIDPGGNSIVDISRYRGLISGLRAVEFAVLQRSPQLSKKGDEPE